MAVLWDSLSECFYPLVPAQTQRFFSCFPLGGSAQALWQSPASITKPERKTVLITCHVSISNFDKVFIHWYRKWPGTAPKRIAYMATRLFLENDNDSQKFQVQRNASDTVLIIKKTTRRDTGTYYCAYWYRQAFTALDGHR
uniref:Ig-like domain-containing protein n=1 Tax=Gallus gallus TaxID=9031 RepID=A0A8V0ZAS6_CHICK